MQKIVWVGFILLMSALGLFLLNPDDLPWLVIPVILVFLFITNLDLVSGLLLFLFIFPLLTILPEQLHGFPFSFALILFLCLFWFTLFKKKNSIIPQTPLDIPLRYFMIIVGFSAVSSLISLSYAPFKILLLKYFQSIPSLFTTYPEDRFINIIQATRNILIGIVFYYFLIYYLHQQRTPAQQAAPLPENNPIRDRIITTMLISSAVSGIYGIIQYITKWNLLEYWKQISPDLTRINATFTDPNSYGTYLVLLLPIAIAKLLSTPGKSTWNYAGLSLLLFLNLIGTASRAAWFSLILSLLLMLFIISFTKIRNEIPWRFLRSHFRKISLAVFLITLLSSAALIAVSTQHPVSDYSQHKSNWEVLQFSLNTHAEADTILKNRLPLWRAAISMLKYQPLVGVGIGSYPFWLESFLDPGVTTFLRIAHAHNYYLELVAELGIIGFGVFIWFISLIFINGWKAVRRFGLVPLGLLTGINAFLIAQFTQHALVQIEFQFLFWIPVAVLMSYQEIQPESVTTSFAKNRNRYSLLLIIFLCSVYGYNFISSDTKKASLDYSVGMYKSEKQGDYEFRWVNRVAYKPIGIRSRTFTLPILAAPPALEPHPATVSIYLNRHLIDRLTLSQPGWSEHQYPVPENIPTSPPDKKDAVLSVLVDRTWNPWKQSGTSVWDYRRLGAGVAWIRWMKPLEQVDRLAIDIGTPDARPYLSSGWYADEFSGNKNNTYVWSNSHQSEIFLPLKPGKTYELTLRILPFVYPTAVNQTITVSLNTSELQTITMQNDWNWQEVKILLPAPALSTTLNVLKLAYSRVNIPKEVIPNNTDTREIAIACDSVIVKPK